MDKILDQLWTTKYMLLRLAIPLHRPEEKAAYLYKEDEVHLVLPPRGVRTMGDNISRVVVQPGQELERIKRHVLRRNPQLVIQLAHCSVFYTRN